MSLLFENIKTIVEKMRTNCADVTGYQTNIGDVKSPEGREFEVWVILKSKDRIG